MWGTTAVAVRRLCAAGDVRSALAMLARGTKSGDAALDVTACTALVNGCCKGGDVAEARRVFDEMPLLGLAPNEVTYTALMHGYFTHGQREKGFALFEEMRRGGVEPNLYTYNCLIGEWCRTGEFERARSLFDEMPVRGIVRNVVSYNTLIAGLLNSSWTDGY